MFLNRLGSSVADPGPGAFLTPEILDDFFPNPGSQTHISESFVIIFGL